jgi:hypothetical protein
MKVLFLSAPYTSATSADREAITRAAEATAMLLWENGVAVVCPHLNSGHFSDHRKSDPGVYGTGYVEIAKRCDGIFILLPKADAKGVWAEVDAVKDLGRPTFRDIKAVLKWARQ